MYAAKSGVTTEAVGSAGAPKQNSTLNLIALLGTLALLAVVCLGQDGMKLFWYDELITLRVSEMPSLRVILHFYEAGKDTTSFLPAMIVHVCHALPGRLEVTTRLPFTFAYLVTCACLWQVLRRRYPVGYAMGAVFLFAQGWSFYFASEIRAYAFVMMGAAIAMACWSAAGDRGRGQGLATAGVFLGLALAILFHFFAIFLLLPFAVAEGYRRRATGETRWGMWAAILLYPATIIVMLPNMLAARATYGKNFWSKPTIGLLTDNYVTFATPIARDLAEIVLLVAVVLWFRRGPVTPGTVAPRETSGFGRPEWLLFVGICVTPFLAFAGAKVLGVYRPQYLLYFQVGTTLLLVGALAEVLGRRKDAGWVFAFLMLLLFLTHQRDKFSQGLRQLAGKSVSRMPSEYQGDWIAYLQTTHLPIVAEGSNTLMIVDQYVPELKGRVVLLTDYRRALKYPVSVTNELNMEVFARDLHLPVQDYNQFVTKHRDFLLLANPEQFPFTWMFHSLADESAAQHDVTLSLLWGSDLGADQVYLVHFGPQTENPTP